MGSGARSHEHVRHYFNHLQVLVALLHFWLFRVTKSKSVSCTPSLSLGAFTVTGHWLVSALGFFANVMNICMLIVHLKKTLIQCCKNRGAQPSVWGLDLGPRSFGTRPEWDKVKKYPSVILIYFIQKGHTDSDTNTIKMFYIKKLMILQRWDGISDIFSAVIFSYIPNESVKEERSLLCQNEHVPCARLRRLRDVSHNACLSDHQ